MAYKNIEDQKAASKRHYLANKARYMECNEQYRLNIQDYVRTLKETTACADCGVSYPFYVMDFDHIDNKDHTISFLTATGRIAALRKEIEKCEIIFANCHRMRTHKRL